MAGARSAAGVRWLWLPNFSDSGNDLSGYTDTVARLVPRDVVGDDPEERCQRVGAATSARTEKIRDGMDMAAQIPARDGATRTRFAGRQGRGG